MNEAVGYTRLSQDGLSIPKQKAKIRSYCERQNLKLREILDDGEQASGYDVEERPAYRELRELVQAGEIDSVVVRDTGRIGRDFDERMYFVLDCRANSVELHSVEFGKHDLSDPWSVLQETAQAAGDDVQKRKEIERSREATEQRIEDGCYHGKPPIGLEFAGDNCHLKKNESEWSMVNNIIQRREQGDTVREIASDVGVSSATVSRISQRGLEWYKECLEEYGTMHASQSHHQ